jgi:hypothetical protein
VAKAASETDEAESDRPPSIGGRPHTISKYDGHHPSTGRETPMASMLSGAIKLARGHDLDDHRFPPLIGAINMTFALRS